MTEQEIAAIAERAQKATPGPWAWESVAEQSNEYAVGTAWDVETNKPISGQIVRTDDPETDNWLEDRVLVRDSMGLGEGRLADGAFIAHARQDIPDLLAALKDAQQSADYYKALWEANAARLVDANLYVSTYLPEQAGRPIWHVILDDAIRLRSELERMEKLLGTLVDE